MHRLLRGPIDLMNFNGAQVLRILFCAKVAQNAEEESEA